MNHMYAALCLIACLAVFPRPALSAEAEAGTERRELWTGSLYSSTYRAGVCIDARGNLRGAVYLKQVSGDVDRYTISGHVDGDRITASHHSGHSFKGRFVSPREVKGELTLKNGQKLEVRAQRSMDPEVDAHCRLVHH